MMADEKVEMKEGQWTEKSRGDRRSDALGREREGGGVMGGNVSGEVRWWWTKK